MEKTISIGGDPNIGVFSRVIDDLAVIPPTASSEFRKALQEYLGVEIVETTIQGSEIIGSLLTGNDKGFVVSGFATEGEIGVLKEYREVFLLKQTMNAAGNVILTNGSITAVHPDMPAEIAREIGEFLGTRIIHLSLGGIKTVGMAGVATDRGIMVHPRSTAHEIQRLEEVTPLPVGTGSVSMGSGLVGAGLLVNRNGYLAGTGTTGFELGRVEDIFGFLE
ncbi:MAG TPA: translation initiation factor IF-6 [Methanoregulaceae archaeon]|nr:translation initiation factor IF-6 [Methanoregulaceae archaeon]